VLHLAALAQHLADLRSAQHRLHQARDARRAANAMSSAAGSGSLRATPSAQATLAPPRSTPRSVHSAV
jgi:hypothetical protein